MQRTGAQILVDQLKIQGVDTATCVPGESYLSVLDALIGSGVDLLTCRQEGGAAMMAETYGKMTGRPGICFVTRGPGATNAAAGVHVAMQDSTPMILFVGQIGRDMTYREAFQELDYGQVFGTMAKWAFQIDNPARIPELIARAFRVATQGRPGPVVIALPEDMLVETADVPDAPKAEPIEMSPSAPGMDSLAARLAKAKKPIAILGGGDWRGETRDTMIAFAERHGLPVAVQFRRGGSFPADHPNYVGDLSIGANPRLVQAVKDADLVLMLGGRMSESPSQNYTLFDIGQGDDRLVHLHPDPEEIGRVYQPGIGLIGSVSGFARAVADWPGSNLQSDWVGDLRQAYLDWSTDPLPLPGDFQMGDVMCWLRDTLGPDAAITNGAGNFATWINRHYRFRDHGSQLAPTSGSMGYGLPAAVMAKRHRPERDVVCIAGDGDIMMTVQELATAAQYDIPVIVLIIDNSMFGTIRMHQERDYPGRVSATELKNPDFAAMATSFGCHSETVRDSRDFAAAFDRARASGKPALLHCFLDPEALTIAKTLSEIRGA
ncbi:acetolactate synthase-1/2/3 large subunit [Pseudooceanicola nitratireducens]|jgi:acetolactate synthase-1/2/3 large subunit|uniref:Acetolactate synthase-1/2/3 large subunit n=1 Tax=Pseudooceanicola nitratireducens TaxID=517719 RepID=A0A1I1NYH3_9RHOB|nr:thiamine pyrophosphate-binding protein [Pseudooceanicola nitratireducens]SEI65800.1 acetolactate synthase-1/2/3 large subunit [Pseudooceanicola nitratireducens]SFD00538.1 acetolactate synthase-1/2/3 large subunit [Pseudooceanicola nitratireducens]